VDSHRPGDSKRGYEAAKAEGKRAALLEQRISRDPVLQSVITDTHFVKRDRMGRLLVFLARILQDGWAKRARAIAVEENAAVLIGAEGSAIVVGLGPAYFLEANTPRLVAGTRRR
jgi:cyanophycinase-like exopeptidase